MDSASTEDLDIETVCQLDLALRRVEAQAAGAEMPPRGSRFNASW